MVFFVLFCIFCFFIYFFVIFCIFCFVFFLFCIFFVFLVFFWNSDVLGHASFATNPPTACSPPPSHRPTRRSPPGGGGGGLVQWHAWVRGGRVAFPRTALPHGGGPVPRIARHRPSRVTKGVVTSQAAALGPLKGRGAEGALDRGRGLCPPPAASGGRPAAPPAGVGAPESSAGPETWCRASGPNPRGGGGGSY